MSTKFSKNLSMQGWNLWKFLKGRKKLVITVIGLVGVKLAFDPELVGLLAGGAVFEGVWSMLEYYFKKV
ncbi:hypothetical protein LCGC14_2889520, partial [marine sediment metagenome]